MAGTRRRCVIFVKEPFDRDVNAADLARKGEIFLRRPDNQSVCNPVIHLRVRDYHPSLVPACPGALRAIYVCVGQVWVCAL